MANYIGATCLSCKQKFQDGDDIVVCPDCGTPYHRACWAENGHCINIPLHESGGSWMQEQMEEKRKEQERQQAKIVNYCPRCGTENPKSNIICSNCGLPLYVQENDPQQTNRQQDNRFSDNSQQKRTNPFFGFSFTEQDRCCGLDPNEEFDGERLEDIANFVDSNTIYYLPLFKKFKETGSKFSINFICLLFPQFYFAHRKMWRMTFLTVIVLFLLSIPGMILSFMNNSGTLISMLEETFTAEMMAVPIAAIRNMSAYLTEYEVLVSNLSTICNYVDLVLKILCCLFGNWLYYRFVLKNVRRIKLLPLSQTGIRDRLRMTGGTSIINIMLALLLEYGLAMIVVMLFTTLLQVF